jgi:putative salt-induced outer membrane protein YdiY
MHARLRGLAIAGAALICGAATAAAQSTDSLGWHFVGNLGYVQTAGNTELSTVSLGDRLSYRPNTSWVLAQTAAWIYSHNDSVETANQILAGLRADWSFRPRLGLYGLVAYERNLFAGVEGRLEEAFGLAWKAVQTPRHALAVDLGIANNQERIGGERGSYWASRLGAKYKLSITDKSYLEENLELLSNLETADDQRVNSTTALVAPLTGAIAIRLGLLVRFDNVPVPGFRKTDTTFTSGIQISL